MDARPAATELIVSIQEAIAKEPDRAIDLAWTLVRRELEAATEEKDLPVPRFVWLVRDMRSHRLIDRIFANDLEMLVRMMSYTKTVSAAGGAVGQRNAREYVALAVEAADKLHNLPHAA